MRLVVYEEDKHFYDHRVHEYIKLPGFRYCFKLGSKDDAHIVRRGHLVSEVREWLKENVGVRDIDYFFYKYEDSRYVQIAGHREFRQARYDLWIREEGAIAFQMRWG